MNIEISCNRRCLENFKLSLKKLQEKYNFN